MRPWNLVSAASSLARVTGFVLALSAGCVGKRVTHPSSYKVPDMQVAVNRFWEDSRAEGVEWVGCLRVEDDMRIAAIKRVIPAWADSGRVDSKAALERCTPPKWNGTIHTHIVPPGGIMNGATIPQEKEPVPEFPPGDRAAIADWMYHYGRPKGYFCVVAGVGKLYCEVHHWDFDIVGDHEVRFRWRFTKPFAPTW